jgi:hypothetical protein
MRDDGTRSTAPVSSRPRINPVVPLNPTARLRGPNGWCGAGWTAPSPGSHHYPEAKGGALIALFYLPAGRISYAIKPLLQGSVDRR